MSDYTHYQNALFGQLSQLGPLSPVAWDAIITHVEWMPCRRGRSLPMREGDLFFLAEGLLKEEIDTRNGVSIQQFVDEGTFFMVPQNWNATLFAAIEPSLVARLGWRMLHELNRRFPELARSYEQIVAQSHAQLTRRISLLILPKNERYAAFIQAFPGLAPRLLDKDIMRYLDISPGYFSQSKG